MISRIKMVYLLRVSVSEGGDGGNTVHMYVEYTIPDREGGGAISPLPTAVGIMGNQKCHIPTYITVQLYSKNNISCPSLVTAKEGGGECRPHDSSRAGLFSPKLN